jgi:tetratricopeptide (TPR) repeat protein
MLVQDIEAHNVCHVAKPYVDFGQYQTVLSLEGVPKVKNFVSRLTAMEGLERVLLPNPGQSLRQKVKVVYGLGGIGKTQLAVEFARRHHRRFSSVFWLDGRSEESLKRSIASQASRIPAGQISETSRAYAADSGADFDIVVKDVMAWLARPDNIAWLLIIDNVDRDYNPRGGDPDAYDVKRYFSGADHGSVLITTRLARLGQLGDSQSLGKVDNEQARAIFESWYRKEHGKRRAVNGPKHHVSANDVTTDTTEKERLLELLDGLPLAIAQAGAYLQESQVGLTDYLGFYQQQWGELMESDHLVGAPLQDYPERSVWTTWAISYHAIRDKDKATANLLLLWSFLDNKDLWHGLFAPACSYSAVAAKMLWKWIGNIASSKIEFSNAMRLLRNYSLVEEMEGTTSYATHPVVHRWAYYSQGKSFAMELGQLAVVTVGLAVPRNTSRDYMAMERQLLPHVQVCFKWVMESETRRCAHDNDHDEDVDKNDRHVTLLDAILLLGLLYADQGRLGEAEQMYERALRGYEEALGPNHTSTLATVSNLGNLYKNQGKLGEAEQMYERALRGYEEALGPSHTSTLATVGNLGNLYKNQGKLGEAEQMHERALRGREEALGPNHTSTLATVSNLGNLYRNQGKLGEAEQMYERALQGYEKALNHEAFQTYKPALDTLEEMGDLYARKGEREKAQAMYQRALAGWQARLGPSSKECQQLTAKIDKLHRSQQGNVGGSKLEAGPAIPKARDKKSLRLTLRKVVDKITK